VTLAARVRPARSEPVGALVLLHGRGADEHDLFPLVDLFDPDARLVAATARAPLALPPGGWHWYAFRQVGYPDPSTFHAVYPVLTEWLDTFLEEHALEHDRLVLGGFSQGAVMTYAVALGDGRPRPAGVVALSGFIPNAEGFALDLSGRLPPAAIGHGTLDPVIDVEFGRAARDALREAGADVTYHESPLPHTIDPAFARELPEWIAARFA
jgi:phospholipase/carboxylesterase